VIAPAYTGYGNGSDGWRAEYDSVADSTLQAYGAALASRYNQGNVVWLMGGDDANDHGAAGNYGSGSTPDRTKQWQIALGIRSVRTTDLISGHTARNGSGTVDGEAYKAWTSGYAGFNLNNCYGHDGTDDMVALAAAAYARPGPMPFYMMEAGYENTDGSNDNGRLPAIQAVLGGALAGFFGGHDALWPMGSLAPDSGGAQSVLNKYLAGSWKDLQYIGQLLRAYAWHKLEPKRDASLVTSALGSGSSAICPARASDGSFAMIFKPGSGAVSVNMAALAPASVRARWYDARSGVYTTINTAAYANTGTRSFTWPGERILVLDAWV
jgi:hypothetical protein